MQPPRDPLAGVFATVHAIAFGNGFEGPGRVLVPCVGVEGVRPRAAPLPWRFREDAETSTLSPIF